jgi:hypothetical protein
MVEKPQSIKIKKGTTRGEERMLLILRDQICRHL